MLTGGRPLPFADPTPGELPRHAQAALASALRRFPAVALLGPRQVGKTTLARALVLPDRPMLYLDLELPSARRQLEDAESFLFAQKNRLVILDEVQRLPELFAVLRAVIDERRRDGETAGQFLLLGSASGALLQQSSESLAGRITYFELLPFTIGEWHASRPGPDLRQTLWVRGGFPLSLLAPEDASSLEWREAFITTYLERDIPNIGPRIPAATLRRLWTMLAHRHGGLLNQSDLAAALGISGQTVGRYIDVLVDLMLVRRLPAWHGNVGKRLVRAPKLYVRDSGLLHALLGLVDLESLLAHPVAGASWEGFVIEQIAAVAHAAQLSFFRTAHGAEADLVVEFRGGETWIIEIKRSSAPTVSRGFHQAAIDTEATRKLLLAPVPQAYAGLQGVEVLNPLEACALIAARAGERLT
jgi:predicted AAA+ superfamily ATPase